MPILQTVSQNTVRYVVSKVILRVAAHQSPDEIMLELLLPESATEPGGAEGNKFIYVI